MTSSTLDPVPAPGDSGHPAPAATPDPAVHRSASLLRLTALELRKAVDTRSGRTLVLIVLALGLAATGYEVLDAGAGPIRFEHWLGFTLQAVFLLLPVVGVMAMTGEWSQRTALTTFALTPRRGRVLGAKVASGVVLGAVVVSTVVAATALGMLVAAWRTGGTPDWGDAGTLVAGALLVTVLQLVMAAAFGALVPVTAAAVTAILVVPTAWSELGRAWLGDSAKWADVFDTFFRLSTLDGSMAARSLTSIGLWIVLPMVAGVVASLRRDVS